MKPSDNYPPGVSGNEPEITGNWPEVDPETLLEQYASAKFAEERVPESGPDSNGGTDPLNVHDALWDILPRLQFAHQELNTLYHAASPGNRKADVKPGFEDFANAYSLIGIALEMVKRAVGVFEP